MTPDPAKDTPMTNDPPAPPQLTQEQAIQIHDSGLWKEMSHRQRAEFQMCQDFLCMPFGVFHEALEKTLGRPVWTHEFGMNRDGLRLELLGHRPPPTMKEIIELVPADKRIVIQIDGET